MTTQIRRVLAVEDEPNWQRLIRDLFQDIADELGLEIAVVIAPSVTEAFKRIASAHFDLVTVDNRLAEGKMAKTLLDRMAALDYKVPIAIISGAVNSDDVREFFKYYEVDEFFWKKEFAPKQFKQRIVKLLASGSSDLQEQASRRREGIPIDWDTVVSLAIAAVSLHTNVFVTGAATAAEGKKVEAISKSVKGMWQWVCEAIGESGDEPAKRVWKDFLQDPQSNQAALIRIILQLRPSDDAVLRGYAQDLIQEVQARADLSSLLDNPSYFTLHDLKRICSRLSPQWEDDVGPDPSRAALVRWIVRLASTRNRLPDLAALVLQMNPRVVLQ